MNKQNQHNKTHSKEFKLQAVKMKLEQGTLIKL
jgi:transposase-like protein